MTTIPKGTRCECQQCPNAKEHDRMTARGKVGTGQCQDLAVRMVTVRTYGHFACSYDDPVARTSNLALCAPCAAYGEKAGAK